MAAHICNVDCKPEPTVWRDTEGNDSEPSGKDTHMSKPTKINHSDPNHTANEDGTCELCDWCPACEKITEYDGETCTKCGREWGYDDAPSTKKRGLVTRKDVIAAAVVIACAAGLGTWMGVLADEESVLGSSTNLAPCVTEDSDNCYWLADESGNLEGRSFVTIDGEVFYLDGAR